MPAFSVITQDPTIRALVQDGMLERAMHDALFPALLFRADVEPILYAGNVGDSRIFTGKGLLAPKTAPVVPGQDFTPSTVQYEQWQMYIQKFGDSIDTFMPNAIVDIANLFLENCATLGLGAGQSLNRVVRNYLYNAALAGHTVTDIGNSNSTSLHVVRLNGFTLARRPDLPLGSAVQFQAVSASNPLPIQVVNSSGTTVNCNVIGFTPDTPGDTVGPGVLLLDTAVTMAVRGTVNATNGTFLVRNGGGNSIDSITSGANLFLLQNIRSAIARFRQVNVRPQASGYYHCHLDPTSEGQIFNDAEFTRLLTALPDSFLYQDFAIGRLLGTIFIRNSECPVSTTVTGGLTAAYNTTDQFGGEVYTLGATTGVPVHRPLFTGMEVIKEYYIDMNDMITEAGVTGKVGEAKVTADGIEVNTDRVQLILRSPLDRAQELVSATWKFLGGWAVRTDVLTGDIAAFKRMLVVEHGE